MNQISIAICDADSAYGNKLAEYLLETGNVAKAEVYTDWNSVEADLNREKRDIWLINSGILKEAESLPLKEEMVCLAEERLGAREAALPHIYKYQSANVILQEMYALLAEHPTEICLRGSRKGHTIGLLSPWYDGLSLLTGLAVAQVLAEKGKGLYINTRGYCGMKLPEMEESHNLSDVLLSLRLGSTNGGASVMSGITTVGELGIMVPVEQAVLLGEVKAQDYHRLLEIIWQELSFDYVILEIQPELADTGRIIEECDMVYAFLKQEYGMDTVEQQLMSQEVKGKIQIIKIPERLQTGERYENSGSPVVAAGYFKEWIAQEIEREEGNEKGMP